MPVIAQHAVTYIPVATYLRVLLIIALFILYIAGKPRSKVTEILYMYNNTFIYFLTYKKRIDMMLIKKKDGRYNWYVCMYVDRTFWYIGM